jgi:hypothetical protein
VLHCDDVEDNLEIKINDLIETFVSELSLGKLYYWTYKKVIKFGYCMAIL